MNVDVLGVGRVLKPLTGKIVPTLLERAISRPVLVVTTSSPGRLATRAFLQRPTTLYREVSLVTAAEYPWPTFVCSP